MKTQRLLALLSLGVGMALSGVAHDATAQSSTDTMNMSGAQMHMPASGSGTASTQAFEQNEAAMMKNMSAPPYTGDTDADFVAHMIPHHQGAVDQAEVELKYGKDPQMRALAKSIIEAQNKEIALMKQWQAKYGVNR